MLRHLGHRRDAAPDCFVVHGEQWAAQAPAQGLRTNAGWTEVVLGEGESVLI